MLPIIALIDFFKNLPYLAVKEVSKHFEDSDRVLLSVISPEWEQTISSKDINGSIEQLIVTGDKFEMEISISPNSPSYCGMQFGITFMNFQFINSDTDKAVITEENENQSSFRISSTQSIIVYRKNLETNGSQRILEIAYLLKRKFQLDLKHAKIENATWMTRNDLLSLKSRTTRITDNQLTDKDFNALLHSWMAGNHDEIRSCTFKIGDDVKIDQVIRGLITEKWDPEKRDRKFIPHYKKLGIQPLIDMADGYDIIRPKTTSDNNLATVHITDNTLYFIVWDKDKNLEEQLQHVKWFLIFYNRYLSREVPGSDNWNRITETRKKFLKSYRNLIEDQKADYLVDQFSVLR